MTISQSIDALPTAPTRSDPASFDTRADAYLSALVTFSTQIETFRTQANTTAGDIDTSESAAAASASLAADWATKTGSAVSGGEYSAKYHATASAASATLAADWANKTTGAVSGGEYSAKYYANLAAASETAAESAASIAASGAGLPLLSGKANRVLTVDANELGYSWSDPPSITAIAYADRNDLRSDETSDYAVVDTLGLFQYHAGSTESDDDFSCFATTNGRWLLEAPHWDVVDAWESHDRAGGRILFGTAASSVTSLATVTQTSFTGTVTGAAIGDRVIANPPDALGARISVFARVTAANTVTIYLNNPSAGTQALNAGIWQIAVLQG